MAASSINHNSNVLNNGSEKMRFILDNLAYSIAKTIPFEDLTAKDTIVIVMGPTGSGKSSFIETAIDRRGVVKIGHGLATCTTQISVVRLSFPGLVDSDICFVDTPGFDDTNGTDIQILKLISDWLNNIYKQKIILAGLLYFHRISDNRMPGSLLKNFRRFEKLCGNDFNRIVLATTMWDEIDEDTGRIRERELEDIYWKAILDHGSSVQRFHQRDRNSAFSVIAPILNKANDKTPLLVQEEMTDRGLSLHQTEAGEMLFMEPEDLLGHLQDVLEKIRSELKQPSVDRKRILQLIEEHDYVSKQLQRSRRHTDRTWRDWFRRLIRTLDWNQLLSIFSSRMKQDRMDKVMQQEVRNIVKGEALERNGSASAWW